MSDHLVICIGRQFGSGGHEIGVGLAKELGIPCYDKEILKKAAQESGIVEELFEKADEKPTNSFLYSLSMGGAGQAMGFTNYNDYLTNDKLFLFQSQTIKKMAEKESCVIIGRCADGTAHPAHLPSAQSRGGRGARPHQKDGQEPLQLLRLLCRQRLGCGGDVRHVAQLRQARH